MRQSVTISGELLDFEDYVYQIIFPVETVFVEMILHIKIPFSAVKRNLYLLCYYSTEYRCHSVIFLQQHSAFLFFWQPSSDG
jgi:hypothetical protein